jgi:CrcB protein
MIMNMILTSVVVGIAGGLGAVARFVLDGVIQKAFPRPTPVGTVVVNLSGSLLLGALAGLLASGMPDQLYLILGTGFLGGYTTFSTACFEVVGLLRRRRFRAALRVGLGTMIFAVLAATLGYSIGSRFGPL